MAIRTSDDATPPQGDTTFDETLYESIQPDDRGTTRNDRSVTIGGHPAHIYTIGIDVATIRIIEWRILSGGYDPNDGCQHFEPVHE